MTFIVQSEKLFDSLTIKEESHTEQGKEMNMATIILPTGREYTHGDNLQKFSESELVYIYLHSFNIVIDNNINEVYKDFLDFLQKPKYLNIKRFINEVDFWKDFAPSPSPIPKESELPLFSFYRAPIGNLKPHANINLKQLHKVISTPKYYEERTNQLRSLKDKDKNSKFKRESFDYVTFSGVFLPRKRNDKDIVTSSGYLCLDLDHLEPERPVNEVKTLLANDIKLEVKLMFRSPNGDGLKIVIPYDIQVFSQLSEFYEIAENYMLKEYQLKTDKQCKNISRACFLPYDNDCYINLKINELC